MQIIIDILLSSWNVLAQSSLYLILGFAIAGLLKAYLPADFVARHLGQNRTSNVIKAALLGIPLPLCSCGVIPAAAELRRKGASPGATASFLISTPETGVDSISITYALMGPFMAVIRPVAAFFTATLTGIMVNLTTQGLPPETASSQTEISPCPSCSSCCSNLAGQQTIPGSKPQKETALGKIFKGLTYSFGDLLADIGLWFLGGVVIAGAIGVVVPAQLFEDYLGQGIIPMILMLAVAIPLYVCATASTPIAAALALKGLSPGAALVFLLAGPATNAATISVVAKILGKKIAAIYVASITFFSLLTGLIANWIFSAYGLNISSWQSSDPEHGLSILAHGGALFLLAMILIPRLQKALRRQKN